jgi:thiamine kinase-like enzyme
MAASHGEFLPQNILIHGSRVGVVDFETYSGAAPVTRDLATFLTYIKMLEPKGIKYSHKTLKELARSFLEGYGNNFNIPHLRLQMIDVMLEILYHRESADHRLDEALVLKTLDDISEENALEHEPALVPL